MWHGPWYTTHLLLLIKVRSIAVIFTHRILLNIKIMKVSRPNSEKAFPFTIFQDMNLQKRNVLKFAEEAFYGERLLFKVFPEVSSM